jgi:hypothetical protein
LKIDTQNRKNMRRNSTTEPEEKHRNPKATETRIEPKNTTKVDEILVAESKIKNSKNQPRHCRE